VIHHGVGAVHRPSGAAGCRASVGYHDYGDPWREQRYRGDCAWLDLRGIRVLEINGATTAG
jgi:hypothetical protein